MADNMAKRVDLSHYRSGYSLRQKCARLAWFWVWLLLFRPTPRFCVGWRRLLLRLFGARMGKGSVVLASTRVWAPWNLAMGAYATIGEHVNVYSVARIELGAHAVVSQNAHLCAATHDYTLPDYPLLAEPIRIGAQTWVCADVFLAPGVTVGEGAVIGARAAVFKDVSPWTVVGGNPAKFIKTREMRTV